MFSDLSKRLIEEIDSERANTAERRAVQAAVINESEAANLRTEALLSQAVFDLEARIESGDAKKKRFLARLLGRRAANAAINQKARPNTIWKKLVDRPDMQAEVAKGIALPVDEVVSIAEHTFENQWSVELPYHPRPIGYAYCEIYRVSTERHTQKSDKEIVYRVQAYNATYGLEIATYCANITSFTNGQADDPLIAEGKSAVPHALDLINQALKELQ